MSRILDIHPDEEADVVNRVVMHVHRYVDEHFPNVANQSSKFSKTVFNTGEDTIVDRINVPADSPGEEVPATDAPTKDTPVEKPPVEESTAAEAAPVETPAEPSPEVPTTTPSPTKPSKEAKVSELPPRSEAPVTDVHEFAVSQHADLEFSKKDQLSGKKSTSTAAKTFKLILLIILLTGVCAFWAYETLLP